MEMEMEMVEEIQHQNAIVDTVFVDLVNSVQLSIGYICNNPTNNMRSAASNAKC